MFTLIFAQAASATGAVEGGGTNNTGNVLSGPSNAASAANGAGKSQGGAQGAAMAMAAAMAAMCNQPPGNIAPCIMAALAAMQGSSLGKTKDGAYNNAGQLSTAAGATGTAADAPVIPGAGVPGAGAVANVKLTLAKQGAKISDDGKTMTLPDGTSVPLTADSATDSGMKAAGLSDQQIALGKQAIADAQAQIAHKKSGEMALDGDGGGGGGAAAASPGSAPDPKKLERAKKSLSGLSKNFGSDKIGVSADDIFEMVTRRYKAKDAENAFIKN